MPPRLPPFAKIVPANVVISSDHRITLPPLPESRAEALIVTTPQPLAQEIAARAALMAQKTNMRLLGVIENMSGEVFGSGGGQELADDLHVPLLGTVPLDPALREAGDAGEPLVTARPDTPAAVAILAVAEAVAETRREQGVGFVKALPVLS